MKTHKKILISTLALSGLALTLAPVSFASATAVNNGAATIPAYLTATATAIDVTIGTGHTISSGDTFVDFDGDGQQDDNEPTIVTPQGGDPFVDFDGDGVKSENEPLVSAFESDAVYMNVAANSNIGTVTDLKVTNNNTASPVYVSRISVSATSPYTKQAFNVSTFKTYAPDSHNFALKINGTTDLINDYVPATADKIEAEATHTYVLEGLSSTVTQTITNQKIADVIITISQNNQ
ncbi:MAG: hypothetical protein Q4F61_01705 [Candidatus Saccharibacteria bacterium]|nr:hypothetical protein [Candidatus Saccharibacteria bacterium]